MRTRRYKRYLFPASFVPWDKLLESLEIARFAHDTAEVLCTTSTCVSANCP